MTETIDTNKLGREAYFAYGDIVGWKNHLGKEMPDWKDLPERIRQAWAWAADVRVGTYLDAVSESVNADSSDSVQS